MSLTSLSLKSNFDLPADPQKCVLEGRHGLIITAESTCRNRAEKLCSDAALTLETGAFPAMHAMLIHRINRANEKGIPLACKVEYGIA